MSKTRHDLDASGGHEPAIVRRSPGSRVYTTTEVSRAIRRLDMALAHMHAELAEQFEVTGLELLAIAHLGMDGAMGPSDLARRLHVTTGAATALVDRLAKGGYADREPHPSDRRRLLVSLTQHARDETHLRVLPMVDEVTALARSLSREDRQTVGRFLDDLVAIMQRYPASADGRP